MKNIIEFNLPEEEHDLELALNAGKWYTALYNLDNFLRGKIKYATDSQPELETETYQKIRDELHALMREYDLDF